ncbi:hypothetical protein [Clostridium sp.]|uniref:hypothetical protein n=1 Tax=Clostridium sp. TaxID=1506 RepID=UPI003991C13E
MGEGNKKITSIIKEEIDYFKKISCFSTFFDAIPRIYKDDSVYKNLLYENSIHKNNIIKGNLLSNPFLAMYFLLLRMELKSYINRTVFVLEQINNYDCKKIKNRNSNVTINFDNNTTIYISNIRKYLITHIDYIASIIYEKEKCTNQEKEYLINSCEKIKKYNEIVKNTSLEIYTKELRGENKIYVSFIIPMLREIFLTEKRNLNDTISISKKNKSKETSKSNNYISMKNVLNKEIDKITYEENLYLHLKLQRAVCYYSDEYDTFKKFLEAQTENVKMVQYMIEKLNSVGMLHEMSDELVKLMF